MYLKRIVAHPLGEGIPIRKAVGPVCEGGWLVTLERADLLSSTVIDADVRVVNDDNLIDGLRAILGEEIPISALNAVLWDFDLEKNSFTWKSAEVSTLRVVARSDIQDNDSGYIYAVQGDAGFVLRTGPLTLTINWPGGICAVLPEDVFFV